MKEALKAIIHYYNYQRYHEGLGYVTPCDVYMRKYLEIIWVRKEAKNSTLEARGDYNKVVR